VIRAELIGIEGVLAHLREQKKRTAHLSPLMNILAGIMHDEVEENFAEEGRPKWQDLAPSTKRQRTRKGTWPGKILQVSAGGLAASIIQQADDSSAQVGTNKRYAARQHFGGTFAVAARKQVVHFSQVERGKITRATRGEDGKLFGGDLFSSRRKARYAMKVDVGAHSVTTPARQFLTLGPEGIGRMERAVVAYLETA
jgi:phage virion morphogenesis protein